jgi:hypothetical protein
MGIGKMHLRLHQGEENLDTFQTADALTRVRIVDCHIGDALAYPADQLQVHGEPPDVAGECSHGDRIEDAVDRQCTRIETFAWKDRFAPRRTCRPGWARRRLFRHAVHSC